MVVDRGYGSQSMLINMRERDDLLKPRGVKGSVVRRAQVPRFPWHHTSVVPEGSLRTLIFLETPICSSVCLRGLRNGEVLLEVKKFTSKRISENTWLSSMGVSCVACDLWLNCQEASLFSCKEGGGKQFIWGTQSGMFENEWDFSKVWCICCVYTGGLWRGLVDNDNESKGCQLRFQVSLSSLHPRRRASSWFWLCNSWGLKGQELAKEIWSWLPPSCGARSPAWLPLAPCLLFCLSMLGRHIVFSIFKGELEP